MSLYKRGSIFWSYVYMDGIRHCKSTGTGNRKKAEIIDNQFKEELNLKRHQVVEPTPEMTFAALATKFVTVAEPKPWHIDRLRILLPYWADVPIGHIHKGVAAVYRKHRHAQKAVTDTTVNRDLEFLRHILFWAVDEGILLRNPLARMRMVPERRKPRVVLSLAEQDKLLAAAAPHLRVIVIAALDTGMRRGELLNQRWEHVDWARNLLSVTHSKTAGGEGREIPFTSRLAALLHEMRQEEGIVFTYQSNQITRVKTAWKAALRRAGIRHYRFHDLRHTFNTRLMEAGVMQEVRKALMGHSSGEEINAIYTHVELPTKRRAIAQLERWCVEQREMQDEGGDTNHEPKQLPAGTIRLLPSGT